MCTFCIHKCFEKIEANGLDVIISSFIDYLLKKLGGKVSENFEQVSDIDFTLQMNSVMSSIS